MRPKTAATPSISEYEKLKNEQMAIENAMNQWILSKMKGGSTGYSGIMGVST
jgi:hypothetical protein